MNNLIVFLAALLLPFSILTQQESAPTEEARHLEDLRRCRDGILDPAARPEQRRRWSEQLFSYDTPQSRAEVVRLLGSDVPDAARRAVCEGIAEVSRRRPERLFDELVAPLMNLLGHEAAQDRSVAAKALAGFSGSNVAADLGAVAASENEPIHKRLTAIDALAPNIHRRYVVEELIGLLDSDVPEITERTVAALEPASRAPIGNDPAQWRNWWQQRQAFTKATWLQDQIQIYRWRLKATSDELEEQRAAATQYRTELANRISEFQREVFRTLPAESKESRLLQWLEDSLEPVRMAAVGIVRTRLADEGARPEGTLLTRLLSMLGTDTEPIRREVLSIVQNLTDEAVVDRLIAVLQDETVQSMRHAILQALGRVGDPKAIPVLVAEISAADRALACVKEAAIALGQLASRNGYTSDLSEAVAALRNRYARTSADESDEQPDNSLRAALLTAMAGVADPSFEPAFVQALDSDDSSLIRPAIEGIRALGIQSKMARLRDLTAHPEPQVRLPAIEALGQLGRADADLECMMVRINPAVEVNQAARDRAWTALRAITSHTTLEERVRAAQRLRDTPPLEITYLEHLLEDLPAGNDTSEARTEVLARLADIHAGAHRHADAAQYMRLLYQAQISRSDPQATATGLRWLEISLLGFPQVSVSEVIVQIATSSPIDLIAPPALKMIEDYLELHDHGDGDERITRLRADLAAVEIQETADGYRLQFPDAADPASSPEDQSSSP